MLVPELQQGPVDSLYGLVVDGGGVVRVRVVNVTTGSPSVGDHNFNVSDGAGGWAASKFQELSPDDFLSDYAVPTFSSVTDFTVQHVSAQTLLHLGAGAVGTIAPGRVLMWTGGTNIYIPVGELFTTLLVAPDANQVATASDVNASWLTWSMRAGRQLALPPANTVTNGSRVTAKDRLGGAGASNITLTTSGGSTFDGAATYVINTNYGFVTFQADQANNVWCRVG